MQRLFGVAFVFALFVSFFSPYVAFAQFPFFPSGGLVPCGNNVHVTFEWDGPENQPESNQYMCIYDECTTCGLVTLAQNLIQLAVFMAVVIAAIMFAYAGALYLLSSANPGNISKAHHIFWDVLLGLVLVLAGWMIIDIIMKVLYGDGPQNWGPWNEVLCGLTSDRDCRVVEKPRAGELGSPPLDDSTKPPDNIKYPGDRGCPAPNSGGCSVAALSGVFGGNAYMAAGICQGESGGNPNLGSKVDRCKDGNSFSWGLFQINLTVHDIGLGCTKAFCDPATGTCYRNYQCRVFDRTLFDKCVAKAKDPIFNMQYAATLSKGGSNWSQWGANCVCKFPGYNPNICRKH